MAIEKLVLKTSIGEISVPYHQLNKLKITHLKNMNHAELITRLGEIINGRLLNQKISILRVVDPTLSLSIANISTIYFTERGIPSSPPQSSPNVLLSTAGDQLLGKINQDKPFFNQQAFDKQTLQFIDFALTEDDDDKDIVAQITLNNHKTQQVQATQDVIHFKTHYGQKLDIPTQYISGLRFQVNHVNRHDLFKHRWKNPPPSLFRDKMLDGTFGPEMICIKGETFLRGNAQGDEDEKPPTPVTPGTFAIGVFEVTYREYDQFCEDTGRDKPDDASWGRANRPVINVTWKDAIAYTKWLSRKTRKHYRLPSDAEWEFAARAGSTTKFWWGDELGTAKANCEGCQSLWDGAQTSPVGRFEANPFGLHDTAGNVFEWVADCWHDKFSEAPVDGSAIEKPGCGKRVIRGGAWSFPAKEIRSANRWRDFPSRRSDDTGFRVARDVD